MFFGVEFRGSVCCLEKIEKRNETVRERERGKGENVCHISAVAFWQLKKTDRKGEKIGFFSRKKEREFLAASRSDFALTNPRRGGERESWKKHIRHTRSSS